MTATQQNTITQEEVDFYQKNGFLQVNNLYLEEEIDELSALTDEMNAEIEKLLPPMEERDFYQQVFLQIVNVWKRDARFEKFTLSKRIAEIASQLMGKEKVRLWHDHLMTKLPGKDGRPTDWHQDYPYWPMNEPGALSVWIPMQDVGWENGCMHFVPGSHLWNMREIIRLDEAKAANIFDRLPKTSPLDVQRVYCPLKKGSVTFHDGRTIHFAGKNTTDEARKVLSVIYMADGTTYNGNSHPLTDEIKTLEVGKPLEGEFFPILN